MLSFFQRQQLLPIYPFVKQIMNMRKISLSLTLLALMVYCNSCDELSSTDEESPEIEGVWVRLPGPSGDRTELAIGGIDGEPVNRVYMCEKKGSTAAGFYKGILTTDNIIIWDDNLPDTHLRITGSQLE